LVQGPGLSGWQGRAGAALAALADPDGQPPRERTLAFLAWAALLSLALHLALISWLGTLPFGVGGPLRISLQARLVAAPETQPPTVVAEATQEAVLPPPVEPRASDAKPAAAPPAEPSVIPDRYFSTSEVDVPAQVLDKPSLIYPENPFLWKLAGTVRVRVFIGLDGRVESVDLVSADPPGHFEDAALSAARGLKYRPATLRGQPVRSRRTIEIVFDPHEHLPGRQPPKK
jgi:TonB family protein